MSQPTIPDSYLRIAKCGRAVGLKGEVALWPISNVDQRYEINSSFVTADARELTIEKIRKKKDHFIVQFAEVNDRTGAESLVNTELFAEPLDEGALGEGEYFVSDCLGKQVVDKNGITRGVVEAFVEGAASDLLQTDNGDLIPFVFIKEIDAENVYVDNPDGLFEEEEK